MARRSASLWLLVLQVVALQHTCLGSSSHSLKIAFFAVVDPSKAVSQFVIQVYMESQIFVCYDSNSRKIQPRVSWVEKLGKEEPQYWQALTDVAISYDEQVSEWLDDPRSPSHKIKDFLTLQGIISCEFQKSRSGEVFGLEKAAYNGEATDDLHLSYNEYCFDLPEKYLSYGNETLMRTVPESNLGLTIGCVVAGLAVLCVIVGSLIFLRSHSSGQGTLQGAVSI